MFPIDNLSRSLKVLLLVELFADSFKLLSVAATGRRTGSSTMPDKTNIPNAVHSSKKMRSLKTCMLLVKKINDRYSYNIQ